VKLALAVATVAAAVAGCGGSHESDTAALRAALVASKASYLHYQAPVWWGKPTRRSLVKIGTSGDYAVAHVSLSGGPKLWRSQWALLKSTSGGWRVLGVEPGRGRDLPCEAPADVMRTLAGGCAHIPDSTGGAIVGPQVSRPASPAEQSAIEKVGRRTLDPGHNSCVQYVVRVSTLDPRFARVRYVFHKPYTNCDLFNGEDLFMRSGHGWRRISGGSEPLPCDDVPPDIVRSLFGICWIRAPR
jgi:hypothetical protein